MGAIGTLQRGNQASAVIGAFSGIHGTASLCGLCLVERGQERTSSRGECFRLSQLRFELKQLASPMSIQNSTNYVPA